MLSMETNVRKDRSKKLAWRFAYHAIEQAWRRAEHENVLAGLSNDARLATDQAIAVVLDYARRHSDLDELLQVSGKEIRPWNR